MKKIISLAVLSIMLSSCASGAKIGNMQTERVISGTSKYKNSIKVSSVVGGQSTSPLWVSKVSNENFSEALKQSLKSNDLLNQEEGKYQLSANLIQLSQPFIGLEMKVNSAVEYTLKDVKTENTVFSKRIENEGIASVTDAFVGTERLRMANERSIKGNISKFLKSL